MANAVLDGVDGILLGAETLRGLHPVTTVETVLKLCHAAEQHFDYRCAPLAGVNAWAGGRGAWGGDGAQALPRRGAAL